MFPSSWTVSKDRLVGPSESRSCKAAGTVPDFMHSSTALGGIFLEGNPGLTGSLPVLPDHVKMIRLFNSPGISG